MILKYVVLFIFTVVLRLRGYEMFNFVIINRRIFIWVVGLWQVDKRECTVYLRVECAVLIYSDPVKQYVIHFL